MTQTFKKLNIVYYTFYLAALLVALIGYKLWKAGMTIDSFSETGIGISSVIIILVLACIPSSLFLFNKKTKQWAQLEDEKEKLRLYTRGSIIRLSVIGANFLICILFFFLLNSQNMIILAGITAVALLFCKPAKPKIITELQLYDYE